MLCDKWHVLTTAIWYIFFLFHTIYECYSEQEAIEEYQKFAGVPGICAPRQLRVENDVLPPGDVCLFILFTLFSVCIKLNSLLHDIVSVIHYWLLLCVKLDPDSHIAYTTWFVFKIRCDKYICFTGWMVHCFKIILFSVLIS